MINPKEFVDLIEHQQWDLIQIIKIIEIAHLEPMLEQIIHELHEREFDKIEESLAKVIQIKGGI